MANSKYEYVKTFEQSTTLLPNTYMIVRIDGRGFHKLSAKYRFEKPNDRHALELMNAAATAVIKELPDIECAYGISDEFSFIFDRSSRLFERRESKILTTVVSTFTSYYVHLWSNFFADRPLSPPMPSFDGRVVLYPSSSNLRDYMSWRQVDCHINNLYNTTFWALVQKGGMDATQAEKRLKVFGFNGISMVGLSLILIQGTIASEKNEILFSEFQMNYNNEAEMFKKGSIIYRDYHNSSPESSREASAPAVSNSRKSELSKTQREMERKRRVKASITIEHTDIIRDEFWDQRPWLLSGHLNSSALDSA